MNTQTFSFKNPKDLLFLIGGAGVLAGLALAIVSWLHICSEECAATHDWRFFGYEFEKLGIVFFVLLPILYFMSRKHRVLALTAGAMVAGALGSEIMFILVQKYKIGHWCPVCLSIAASVGIVAACMVTAYFMDLYSLMKEGKKGDIMKKLFTGFTSLAIVCTGFVLAFVGVAKVDKLHAEESTIGKSIAFGNQKSPIEVYIITDWFCPACRALEPTIEKASPGIEKEAKLYFVDFPIHDETSNYTPYNLSFMINNKDKYLQLRSILHDVSLKNPTPTDEDIKKAIEPLGVKYSQLNYVDVAVGIKYFKHLTNQFEIHSTPTVVIVNRDDKKGKKLTGAKEITEANIMGAIDSLSEKKATK